MSRSSGLQWVLAGIMALLAGCGGGGGGGSAAGGAPEAPSAQVTLNPSSISSSFVSNGNAGPITVKATVSGVPAGPVYAVIAMDQPVLSTTFTAVYVQPDGSYMASLVPNWLLAPGKYEGNLTLHLCRDSNCASEYALSGATLPYSFEVRPALSVTAAVNGAKLADTLGEPGHEHVGKVNSGDTVIITSNIPVTWTQYSYGPVVSQESTSPTSWSGVITGPSSSSIVHIEATPIDTSQNKSVFWVSIR